MKSFSMLKRQAGGVILVGLLLLAAGCSGFRSEWKQAMQKPPGSHPGMTGPWEGHWRSDVNGHNGRLRCVISEVSTNVYRAHFQATYRKILRFSYALNLKAEPVSPTRTHFRGETKLGKNPYTYEGEATPERFDAQYKTTKDHGIFQMTRPKVE